MIKKCIFVDVFTTSPYAGNQLAVFPHAENLNSDQMQRLANEINYSETTFIFNVNDPNADFEIRTFTPKMEVPFAGHPTLGTAFAIAKITDLWSNKKGRRTFQTLCLWRKFQRGIKSLFCRLNRSLQFKKLLEMPKNWGSFKKKPVV
jgi:PhzF family phenazine biosynthesis protein